jgi:hypothetical protein
VMKQIPTSKTFFTESPTRASLVLGGYDEEKCNYTGAETQQYPLKIESQNFDHFRVPTMNLLLEFKHNNSIIMNYSTTKVILDNTSPFTELPQVICIQIAKLLDLDWDPISRLYLVSYNILDKWLHSNVTFTFEFLTGSPNPYVQAIDWLLPTKPPLVQTNTTYEWYLPIRPLEDGSNNLTILGRSFFRTACLTADYGHNQFAIIPLNQSHAYKESSSLIPIYPPAEQNQHDQRMEAVKIFLIVLGGVVGSAAYVSFCCLIVKRREWIEKEKKSNKKKAGAQELGDSSLVELDSRSTSSMSQLNALRSPVEMLGPVWPIELEGSPITSQFGGRAVVRIIVA